MPCYQCGTRQVDPERGSSPWLRAVRADRQVLICPGCQAAGDWSDGLDRCPECASIRLIRRLGEVECRDCGEVTPPGDSGIVSGPVLAEVPPGLAEDVERALARVFRRVPRTAGVSQEDLRVP